MLLTIAPVLYEWGAPEVGLLDGVGAIRDGLGTKTLVLHHHLLMSSINLYIMKVRANYLNRSAKQAFYTARKRSGDVTRIAETTGYSASHISNVMAGRRKINDTIANEMYNVSRRRMKNSEKPEMADYDLELRSIHQSSFHFLRFGF